MTVASFMIDILMQICASILGNEWSPVLSVVAVCVTLQSMLASCKVRCCCPPIGLHHCLQITYTVSPEERTVGVEGLIPLSMKLIYDVVLLRPTDNDRYVRNAPENPKKVREPYFAFRR